MKYSKFEISSFRLFKSLKLDDCKKINLIAGKNNTGKTSLLEGIFLHSGYYNPSLTLTIQGWRGTPGWEIKGREKEGTPWEYLFNTFGEQKEIIFKSTDYNNNIRNTKISILKDELKLSNFYQKSDTNIIDAHSMYEMTPRVLEVTNIENTSESSYYLVVDDKGVRRIPNIFDAPFQTTFHPSRQRFSPKVDTDRYSALKILGQEDILLKAIQIFDQRVADITISTIGNIPELYVDIGYKKYVPLLIAGEGLVKIVNIMLEIYESRNGIFIIDEFENGFHYSILSKVWEIIDEASNLFDVQIFASTHSLENIKAAHKHFSNKKQYNFKLYRLEKFDNMINTISYDKKQLESALKMELEVR